MFLFKFIHVYFLTHPTGMVWKQWNCNECMLTIQTLVSILYYKLPGLLREMASLRDGAGKV